MTHSPKFVSALRNLADCIEEATIIQYGQAVTTGNEQPRSVLRPITHRSPIATVPKVSASMKAEHVAALYVTLELREAAFNCTDGVFNRETIVSLMERATDLKLPLSEGVVSLSIVRLIAAYRTTDSDGESRHH